MLSAVNPSWWHTKQHAAEAGKHRVCEDTLLRRKNLSWIEIHWKDHFCLAIRKLLARFGCRWGSLPCCRMKPHQRVRFDPSAQDIFGHLAVTPLLPSAVTSPPPQHKLFVVNIHQSLQTDSLVQSRPRVVTLGFWMQPLSVLPPNKVATNQVKVSACSRLTAVFVAPLDLFFWLNFYWSILEGRLNILYQEVLYLSANNKLLHTPVILYIQHSYISIHT